MSLSCAAVTPVRNEPDNLRSLYACLTQQRLSPMAWIIVDNGSLDETPEVASRLARENDWIQAIAIPGDERARPGAPIVRAFHAGLEALASRPDVILKLDADVSFDADYLSRLVQAFADDPSLGIASGTCLELEDGEWEPQAVTGDHVRGATRAYRRECLEDVMPLEERVGWDTIDELKATVLGWQTRIVGDLTFRHHRSVGARDGARSARWRALGSASYYLGYRFSYLLLRALHRARRDPAALAMISSYLGAVVRREPRCADERIRTYLRSQQTLRRLPQRAREALGRA
jgi:biofilm PGA synthesis N-glycosyltransferase PgaC